MALARKSSKNSMKTSTVAPHRMQSVGDEASTGFRYALIFILRKYKLLARVLIVMLACIGVRLILDKAFNFKGFVSFS